MATDWVVSSGDVIAPYRSPWGTFPMTKAAEAGSASFLYGDLVEIVGSGSSCANIQRASTTGSTCNSVTILGVAGEAASSVQGTVHPVYQANPLVEFTARSRGGVLGSSCVNQSYGLFRDSTKNVWLVDFGNKVDTSCRVLVTDLIDGVGDSGGRVVFKFGSTNSTLVCFANRVL